jgi:hypothetical protein
VSSPNRARARRRRRAEKDRLERAQARDAVRRLATLFPEPYRKVDVQFAVNARPFTDAAREITEQVRLALAKGLPPGVEFAPSYGTSFALRFKGMTHEQRERVLDAARVELHKEGIDVTSLALDASPSRPDDLVVKLGYRAK